MPLAGPSHFENKNMDIMELNGNFKCEGVQTCWVHCEIVLYVPGVVTTAEMFLM